MLTVVRHCVVAMLFYGIETAQSGAVADVWAPVRFLVGTWDGDVDGQPGKGQSVRECHFVLNDKYLEVRNKSTYPAQPKNPKGEVHVDWGMMSYDGARKQLVLRQFHVEGFVNQYSAEPARDSVLRFTSESIENIPTGFRARETYTITGPDTFTERFEIAEPGKGFTVYEETHFRRRK